MDAVVKRTQELIAFPSVTPAQLDVFKYVESFLRPLGFHVIIKGFEDPKGRTIYNMYVKKEAKGPNICLLGHLDVVPTGDESLWRHPPYEGIIEDDYLYGRGAVDMKGAVAAFLEAVRDYVQDSSRKKGTLSILLTGDEEGPGTHGTKAMVEWLEKQGEEIDACIIGEPTASKRVGDTIKVGRRGSVNFKLTLSGTQGHVAYPEKADNPLPKLIHFLEELNAIKWDDGYKDFQPTNLEITSIDVGNTATNVIPAKGVASFNLRFNLIHTVEALEQHIHEMLEASDLKYTLERISGFEPFMCSDEGLVDLVSEAIKEVCAAAPQKSVAGGTSDGRFIHHLCPVVEVGLVNETIHATNECVFVKDLQRLQSIYFNILCKFHNR